MKVTSVLPKDSIPSIDNPEFGQSYFGVSTDEVIVFESSPARAYPIRILSYHEIVNDEINDPSIAVTWCPICWSAIVYERRINNKILTFGMSGKLADDALVMFDRETGSEWKQPTGVSISGEFEGSKLPILVSQLMTWNQFRETYPDGLVLQAVHGNNTSMESPAARYDMKPYERYKSSEEFGLFGMRSQGERRTWNRTDLDAKTVVLGIEYAGTAKAYPIPVVGAQGGVITDSIGDLSIVVILTADQIVAYENPGYEFSNKNETIYGDGTQWDPVTGEGDDGRVLTPVPSRRMFAFAWQDAHGEDSFYK